MHLKIQVFTHLFKLVDIVLGIFGLDIAGVLGFLGDDDDDDEDDEDPSPDSGVPGASDLRFLETLSPFVVAVVPLVVVLSDMMTDVLIDAKLTPGTG